MSLEKTGSRLFFAVCPDGASLDILAANAWRLAESSHGKVVPTPDLHLTLLFLGEQPREKIPAIIEAASNIQANGFEVICDKLRYMNDQHLIWTGASSPDPALAELRTRLADELDYANVTYDQKRFKPHVTLVRKALEAPRQYDFTPCRWNVSHFCLMESNLHAEGPRYQVLGEWLLMPPKPVYVDRIIKLSSATAY